MAFVMSLRIVAYEELHLNYMSNCGESVPELASSVVAIVVFETQ